MADDLRPRANPVDLIALAPPIGEPRATPDRSGPEPAAGALPHLGPAAAEYGFLLDLRLLGPAAFAEAADAAVRWNMSLPAVAIALGLIGARTYARTLASIVGAEHAIFGITVVGRHGASAETAWAWDVLLPDRRPAVALDALSQTVAVLTTAVEQFTARGITVVVMAPADLVAATEVGQRRRALRHAVFDLARRWPDRSASSGVARWQAMGMAVLVGLVGGGAVVAPGIVVAALFALLTLPFIGVVLVRLVALAEAVRPPVLHHPDPPPVEEAALPTYSVLVPLYRETEVLESLVDSLAHLDYPTAKLDIILVLEQVDFETTAAMLERRLPAHMRVVVVPDGQPRTKPKALNYAMQFAGGTFVVVFDAEDRPEPDQLRRAAARFASGPSDLACLQARLDLYNAGDSWFARQFTIEYAALFGAILPALDRLRLPIPLGGTSNHFPRRVLLEVGGWDPYNVTEDADLGLRLARFGYRTEMLASTTWEEAPVAWQQWLPQRTRWLKGWFQTYLVHTRQPRRLHRELGLWRSLGFHVFLGGVLLSALVHPLFYALVAWHVIGGPALAVPDLFGPVWFWVATLVPLVVGYASAILVGYLATRRRHPSLARSALWMPICWLAISLAAYRALWQLRRDPFLWEKTAHGRTQSAQSEQARLGKGPKRTD